MSRRRLTIIIFMILVVGISGACAGSPAVSPSPTSTLSPTTTLTPTLSPSPAATYSQYQLEYRLMSKYPGFFWCDPDVYPISRPGQEESNSQQQFPATQSNTVEFSAILEYLSLANKSNFTDAEKLSIYREHKKLTHAVALTPSGNNYDFSIRTGENQGLHIEGTITASGQITVTKQEPSFNTCPICLTQGTLIDTPEGPIPAERLHPGTAVWTRDSSGNRVAAPIIKVSSTAVPDSFLVVKVSLADGRIVAASPGHPTAEMKALGDYRVGDLLDGSPVIAVQYLAYSGGDTYDLLPAGGTGLYWANEVLLHSTLFQ